MDIADMPQRATSLTMDLKEVKKEKEKKGSTSLPAKAVKRAKKEIMAMVMEGIQGEGREPAKPKGTKAEQASEIRNPTRASKRREEGAGC